MNAKLNGAAVHKPGLGGAAGNRERSISNGLRGRRLVLQWRSKRDPRNHRSNRKGYELPVGGGIGAGLMTSKLPVGGGAYDK